MDNTAHPTITTEKSRDMNTLLGGSTSSMETGATEPLENSISENAFGSSMDFDRHTQHARFKGDDSESFNWEDSFAIDETQTSPDQRVALQSGLETVVEPNGHEEDEDEEQLRRPAKQKPSRPDQKAEPTAQKC